MNRSPSGIQIQEPRFRRSGIVFFQSFRTFLLLLPVNVLRDDCSTMARVTFSDKLRCVKTTSMLSGQRPVGQASFKTRRLSFLGFKIFNLIGTKRKPKESF